MKRIKSFLKALNPSSSAEVIKFEAAIANFTPRAQQVLQLARKEADRFNHNYVGTASFARLDQAWPGCGGERFAKYGTRSRDRADGSGETSRVRSGNKNG